MQEKNDQGLGISKLAIAFRKAIPYLNLIYVVIASILMVGALGWFGDKYFQTKPVLTIIGIFFGLGIGFYNFFKSLKHLEK